MIKKEEYKDLFLDVLKNNKTLEPFRNLEPKPTAEETYDFVIKKFNLDTRKGKYSDENLLRYWSVVKIRDFFVSQLRNLDSKKKQELRIQKYKLWIDFLIGGNSIYNFSQAFGIAITHAKRELTKAISELNEHTGTSYTYDEFKKKTKKKTVKPVDIQVEHPAVEEPADILADILADIPVEEPAQAKPAPAKPAEEEPEEEQEPEEREMTVAEYYSEIKKMANKLYEDKTIDAVEYNVAMEAIESDIRVEEPLLYDPFETEYTFNQDHLRRVFFWKIRNYLIKCNRFSDGFKDFINFRF